MNKTFGDDMWSTGSNGQASTNNSSSTSESKTPVLDSLSTDLSIMAKNGELLDVIGRDEEIRQMILILSKKKKANPIILGVPGIGKTELVNGVALEIHKGNVPQNLEGYRLVILNSSSIVADTKYRGEMEKRLLTLIDEASNKENKIILFIDEIHTIIGGGAAGGSADIANILKPALANGSIKVIGATTLDEYDAHIKSDSALERRFQKINLQEPSFDVTMQILERTKHSYEKHHNVIYPTDVVEMIVKTTSRYITDRHQPDISIDTMDYLGASVNKFDKPSEIEDLDKQIEELTLIKTNLAKEQKYEEAANTRDEIKVITAKREQILEDLKNSRNPIVITMDDANEVISMFANVPIENVERDDKELIRNIGTELKKGLIGQDSAVAKVERAVQKAKLGLSNPNKPLLTSLFIGSTGVGKTELAKQLAKYLFGDENKMVRVDMSEFSNSADVSKMVGSSKGYVGYDEEPKFLQQVRHNPYSIVLLDEIEKAHPSVFNVLLQMLDEGHMTSSKGSKVNFKNCIIIMTSNVGVRDLNENGTGISLGKKRNVETINADKEEFLTKKLKAKFSPEFLNRIDETIYFNDLSDEAIRGIIALELKKVTKRFDETKKALSISFTDEVIDLVHKIGYNTEYGARGVKRFIESNIVDKVILDALLSDDIEDKNIIVGVENDKFVFTLS